LFELKQNESWGASVLGRTQKMNKLWRKISHIPTESLNSLSIPILFATSSKPDTTPFVSRVVLRKDMKSSVIWFSSGRNLSTVLALVSSGVSADRNTCHFSPCLQQNGQHILRHILLILTLFIITIIGNRGSTVVKVLYYKFEGRGFDSRWCHWNFSLT